MAKVTTKSEKLIPFEGILSLLMEQFDSMLSLVIDSTIKLQQPTCLSAEVLQRRRLLSVVFSMSLPRCKGMYKFINNQIF